MNKKIPDDTQCIPPLDCSREDLVAYIRSMKNGDRVMEMGGSAFTGETGVVEVREDGGVYIKWDTVFECGRSGMVTSFTGGARLIPTSPTVVRRICYADVPALTAQIPEGHGQAFEKGNHITVPINEKK